MSQQDKSFFYQQLKAAGVDLSKSYPKYTEAELRAAYEALQDGLSQPVQETVEPPEPLTAPAGLLAPEPPSPPRQQPVPARPPTAAQDPREMAGQRLNSKPLDEPIRTDEHGLIWYQEEVRKPAFPKPRGRRVLKYMETGTKVLTVPDGSGDGEFVESFEVAGDQPAHLAEVKITLPSYQVGLYKDPRYPFRIHVYNEQRGFSREEVEQFYGGRELVPAEVKRIYVENVLCYDMRTVIRAIQTEFRQQQLAGRIQ